MNKCNISNHWLKGKYWISLAALLSMSLGSACEKKKLFELKLAKNTGIHFSNDIKDTKESNIFIYSNFYGGAGVGIADFNRDGFQDIFFAGNQVADRLYINSGDLQFEDATIHAGIEDNGGWSSGIAIADVNMDGWEDIYVTRELYDNKPELRRNKLYINQTGTTKNGKLRFVEQSEKYRVDDAARSRHAIFLDYDLDGDPDLFVLNQPPNPGSLSDYHGSNLKKLEYASKLYRNDRGTFTDVTRLSGLLRPGFPNSAVAFDANSDGYPDIYVSNDFDVPDFFFLNNGNGTFSYRTEESFRHISYFSMGVDVADINNDLTPDLMVLDMVAEDNFRLKSNMSGMNPQAFWDLVEKGGHYQYMFNTLQINMGNKSGLPQFSDRAQLAGASSTDWSWSNVLADFDNDGLKDAYVTNGLLRDIRNTDSDKEVSKYIVNTANEYISAHPNQSDISIWDILDLDEALDLIPYQTLSNYTFRNLDGHKFEKVSTEWGLDAKAFSSGCAYGDLDNDGDLDLVVSNINEKAFVYENTQTKHHYLRVQLTDREMNRSILGALVVIEQDGLHQLYEQVGARGMYSVSERIAHFGLIDDAPVHLQITWPDQKQTKLSNIKVDQQIEVDWNSAKKVAPKSKTQNTWLTPVSSPDFVHKENHFDDFQKQVLLPHKLSQLGPALAVADLNGDNLDDIFVGAAAGESPALYFQNESGDWIRQQVGYWLGESQYEDVDAQFLDVDNDGDLDLYVVSGGNAWPSNDPHYQDRLYLNSGGGQFELTSNLPQLRESGSVVRPCDIDLDGDLDLFVGGRHKPWNYPSPASSFLLRNDNGIFTDITPDLLKEIGMVTDALWTDLQGDKSPDLILVGEWMPLTFLSKKSGQWLDITSDLGLSQQVGWWYSIEQGDLDSDGDIDLVVGNLGLNYKYKATAREPFEVYYDDFDQNGSRDIVLSYYNFGQQFPLRGRSCSSEQVPDIKKKFESYDLFASATLADVYGASKLRSALHYSANTFASISLINEGSKGYIIRELPMEAQVTSIHDILIDDFDGDGNTDVLLAGNMLPVEVETTRNDAGAGLLLSGNGTGSFNPVPYQKSGFWALEEVKKMKILKSTQGRQVILGVNDGPLKTYYIKTKNQ